MFNIILFIFFLFIVTGAYGAVRGAPWLPTEKDAVQRFVKFADIKKGEKFYDLGCGDGRLVFAAAKEGAEAKGLEVALFPFLLASFLKMFQKEKRNIRILYKDVFLTNLSDADVVYFFLLPKIYPKVKEKLEKEMKKGSMVVTFVWPIEGWDPVKVDKKEKRSTLYLYKI
jgi:SAM-dependent methyltransferase